MTYDEVTKEVLKNSLWVKLLDVEFLGESLRKAYEGVVEDIGKLRFITVKAKLTFKHKLESIEGNVAQKF